MGEPNPNLTLLLGQNRILEMVATGAPLQDTLDRLLALVEAQIPGVRCGLAIVSEERNHFRGVSAPSLPQDYRETLDGMPIVPPYFGSCGEAAHTGAAVSVPDIQRDTRYATPWRGALTALGLTSVRSIPVFGADAGVLASLAIYVDSGAGPVPLDEQVIEVATRTAAIALQRHRTEHALQTREAQLRAVLETVPAAVWFTYDGDASSVTANPFAARLMRMAQGANPSLTADPIERPSHFRVRIEGRDVPDSELPMQRAARGEQVAPQELEIVFEDGTSQTILTRASPMRNAREELMGAVCTAIDITERKAAEGARLRSESEFRALADNLPNPCWMAHADGWIYWYNPRWYEYTGTMPAQMEGWGWQSVHEPEALPAVIERWTASIRGGAPFEMTFPLRGADGVFRPFLTRVVPLMDASGNVVKWVGTNVDVSEQQRSEAALRVSEARLRELNADLERQVIERAQARGRSWQVSPDLMGALNAHGYFVTSNPAWKTVLGWTEDEIASMSIFELVHPEDVERTRVRFELTKRGEPAIQFPNRYRCKEGGYRWISWVGVPEGGLVYCVGRDITADKDKEAQLAARTAERDRMWSRSQDMLVVIDRSGMFQAVSPAATRILGWQPEEMTGRTVFDFVHPDDQTTTQAALAHAITDELPMFDNRYRHRDGTYRWLSWVAAPDGDRIFATSRHVTAEKEQARALRQAEEALRQAQRMEALGQLAGGIAHDFNNVLQAVTSGLRLIGRRAHDAELVQQIAGMASDAAARGAGVTARLLAFARKGELRTGPVPPAPMLGNLREILTATLGAFIDVHVDVATGTPNLLADKAQLETSLINLAVNARDAMPDGGRLVIRAEPHRVPPNSLHPAGLAAGRYVRIALTDSGAGMDEATLARASEPFFTTKAAGQGTGLGLAMARGFAQQSGGGLVIRSAPGRGTTVALWFPATEASEASAPVSVNSLAAQAQIPPRVMLVDDDPLVRSMLARQLEEEGGCEVTEISDGLAALDHFDGPHALPDVLITDFAMPGMNGLALTQEVRRRQPLLPVALLTGYADPRTQRDIEAILDERTLLIRKPIVADELLRAIVALAAMAPARQVELRSGLEPDGR